MSSEAQETIFIAIAVAPWLVFLAFVVWSTVVSLLEERDRRVQASPALSRAETRQRKAA